MAQDTPWKTRQRIIHLKQQGVKVAEIAEQVGVSPRCVKRLWQRFRAEGEEGLRSRSRRPKTEHPYQVSGSVRKAIEQIKRAHPHWGAQFIQGELQRRRVHPIPHRRTIERFLARFPEFPKRRYQRRVPAADLQRAIRLHQLWQADFKVNYQFSGQPARTSFLNIRDMASTQCILSYLLPHGRSAVTSREMIGIMQQAFSRWKCLPEAVRTDHGSCFCAPEWDAFPTDFTLYLWGLGIEHELIPVRRPTHNGGIERDQRTFTEQFLVDYSFQTDPQLAADAKKFGEFRNRFVPCRSTRCQGRTPEATAQGLECQAVPYRRGQEAKQFDLDRIYQRLAARRWRRTVSGGYVTLGHARYYVGRAYLQQNLELTFDRQTCQVVASTTEHEEIKRWPIRGISYHEIVHGRKQGKVHTNKLKDKSA
jgi:transposase InsO family protein